LEKVQPIRWQSARRCTKLNAPPAPPHDSSGHTWHHADPQLLEIIAQGGSMPNSKMPAYADVLSPAEMEAVLAYIKTFWGEREQQYQEQVTKQFEAQ
jgi:mono/diheme cytochrome c family protein